MHYTSICTYKLYYSYYSSHDKIRLASGRLKVTHTFALHTELLLTLNIFVGILIFIRIGVISNQLIKLNYEIQKLATTLSATKMRI